MSILKVIIAELNRAIVSIRFLITVVLVATLYFASSFYEFVFYGNFSNVDVLHFFEIAHNVGALSPLIIICAVIPYSMSFCEEYQSQTFLLFLHRCNPKEYSLSKILSSAISSGLSCALGIVVFLSILLLCSYPIVSTQGGVYLSYMQHLQNHTLSGSSYYFLTPLLLDGKYYLFFLCHILLVFIVCSFWGAFAMMISGYIVNREVLIFTPFIAFNIEQFLFPPSSTSVNTQVILWGNFSFSPSIKLNFLLLFFALSIALVVFNLIFMRCVKRRATNAV